ncbi:MULTISPECIES: YggS family pyridoxal phosphate-dependent enzyme [unclassified Massilia]|uniref:YggS family pyridoxal phosphate-dependent enzyme n=1 Tax=unclassified Massilia TaxID=2609279 RepID=UPI00178597B2|nr:MULTISPECIES: YggS family pyridoxal phosphate-dependent enzyme [unclassified Massilia]MBD8529251.1 YggS family pyridoxal phosphate-dependent enzyme [Massilia sp. CFBP 13647]MBD8672645.1 YggS family pyridoxal phosphate-dependent enzyme [Massilia sp. CFBP 13721]
MSTIAANLQAVEATITAATEAAKRPRSGVQLLAVSKTFPMEAVLEAIAAGQRAFGENYLQEGVEKIAAVARAQPDAHIEWHFIGPIQSNKTRPIATSFAWVHTVERLKIAQRLSEQRLPEMGPLNICLQVNISGEATKSGATPVELPALARQVASLPNLRLRGLMAIPEAQSDPALQRAAFSKLRALADSLRADGLDIDTLSMGMSGDMEAAILEGATIVRVGSAIFGSRHYD